MINATTNTFSETVIAQDGLTLVDFWADWCPPCKILTPILEEIDYENADITVVKVDADENVELCRNYQILSLPTILVFRDGEIVETLIGGRSKERLLDEIDGL